ncbi:MAG: sulfurtransferase TusA family protein [Actinomycetes bacterium]
MSDEPLPPDATDVRVVDALGLPCPKPVIELAAAVREVPVGARVRLLADDVAAKVDVPVWCRMQRQTLVSVEADGATLVFLVEKARELA